MNMRYLRPWIAVVGALLCASAVAGAEELPWKAFESKEGRFVVEFPGVPRQRNNARPTAKFGTLEQHMFLLEVPNTGVFTVSYMDYPRGAMDRYKPDQLLDDARDTALKISKGKLVSETKVTMGGFPGRAIVFEGANNLVFSAHYYVAKERVYSALAYVPKATADSPSVKRFLDSFKLL
jgi:hypothetical protein